MKITSAVYAKSSGSLKECPESSLPEFAFIGRSNVGKSSLINMLTNKQKLAHTSVTPGKTQCLNHFLINNKWYLVDLPGYGYAKVSKKRRAIFSKIIEEYLLKRETLYCIFVLIDTRIEPQQIDLDFIDWLGKKELPFAIAFTKADKLGKTIVAQNIATFKKALKDTWEQLPYMIATSATEKTGKDELLQYIEQCMVE